MIFKFFKRIPKSKRRRPETYINRINRNAYQKRPHKQRKEKKELFIVKTINKYPGVQLENRMLISSSKI